MVTKKKKKKLKKKKPKGKLLSQAMEEKEAARAEGEDAEEGESSALASEPPPRFDDDEEPAAPEEEEEEEEAEREAREAREEIEREREAEKQTREREQAEAEKEAGEDEDEDEGPASASEDEGDEDEEVAAAHMGKQRYVIGAFFALWLVGGYVLGRSTEGIWSRLAAKDWFMEKVAFLAAIPHEGELISRANLSLLIGGLISAAVVLRYYYRPDVRQWTDEIADEISQVKWPTRKEIGNNTVVVLVTASILTAYLTVLDRLWSFVTNLIYTGGAGT